METVKKITFRVGRNKWVELEEYSTGDATMQMYKKTSEGIINFCSLDQLNKSELIDYEIMIFAHMRLR